jgi:hypothetical protein
MVRVETLEHVFEAPFEAIALASWLKYPNALRPDVLGLDVLDRHYDHETGTLTAYRLSLIRGGMPAWVCAVTGGCVCLFLEKSVVNPRTGFMQLSSENVTCNQIVQLRELCTYTRDLSFPLARTLFTQRMAISANVWGLGGQIEKLGADSFRGNALGGREIMMNAVRLIPRAVTGHIFDPRDVAADKM